jgi:mRNA interferase RelE/StbE
LGLRPGACRRMRYEIRYSDEAIDPLKALRTFDRTTILDQIEQVLGVNPTTESKARVKRLRQPAPTQYRLRVGEFRVFDDVDQQAVLIIQILSKPDTHDYLGGSS